MNEIISEKAGLFMDGGYLNKILKEYFDKKQIDYLKLSEEISKICEVKRLRTYFYTCMPIVRENKPEDIERQIKMEKFLTKLKRLPRFEVKLGKLQLIGNQFKQKMVDVLMSLDIATMCYEKQISHAIIIAGDSDFIPAIRKAKERGAIIHLFYYPKSVHENILDEVDELHEIKLELINKVLQN